MRGPAVGVGKPRLPQVHVLAKEQNLRAVRRYRPLLRILEQHLRIASQDRHLPDFGRVLYSLTVVDQQVRAVGEPTSWNSIEPLRQGQRSSLSAIDQPDVHARRIG